MDGCFLLPIKDNETDAPLFKDQFFVQGHTYAEKRLVNSASNIWNVFVRLQFAITVVFRFRIWTQDVSQAYFQSAQSPTRKVPITPSSELHLQSDECLQLLKLLYGSTDDGDYWNSTQAAHFEQDL